MLVDDLRSLAEQAYRLALRHCGACRDYHAVWPYLRLAGAVGGVEADRDVLVGLLRAQSAAAPIHRLAIAGSADTGLLDVVVEALALSGSLTVVTVVDRCPTPLMLCRERARVGHVTVRTVEGDLREVDLAEAQDVVLLHSVLPFFPIEQHVTVLERLRAWLRPGGTLLLSSRMKPDFGAASEAEVADRRASGVLTALAELGIPLPEPEEEFRARLIRRYASQTERSRRLQRPQPLAALAEAAGFEATRIVHVSAPPRSTAVPYPLAARMIVVATSPARTARAPGAA